MVPLDESLRGLSAAAGRVAHLLAVAPDMRRPVARSEWTVGEMMSHLILALEVFTESLAGDTSRVESFIPDITRFRQRLEHVNRTSIAAEPLRDAPRASADLMGAADTFVAACRGRDPNLDIATPWYGPQTSLTLGAATQLLVGEQLIHGLDFARTLRRPWPIDRGQATLVLGAVRSMFPIALNPDTTVGVAASVEFRPWGAERFVVRIADGDVTVECGPAAPVDCHLAGDPLALVLLGYGRTTQLGAIARGKLVTWGRKPWLAFRFPGYFFKP